MVAHPGPRRSARNQRAMTLTARLHRDVVARSRGHPDEDRGVGARCPRRRCTMPSRELHSTGRDEHPLDERQDQRARLTIWTLGEYPRLSVVLERETGHGTTVSKVRPSSAWHLAPSPDTASFQGSLGSLRLRCAPGNFDRRSQCVMPTGFKLRSCPKPSCPPHRLRPI